MSLSEIALQGNRFLSVLIREREIHFCSPANPVTIRQSGIREGKARILTDGLLKVTRRTVNGFRVPLAPEIAASKISLIGRGIGLSLQGEPGLFLRRDINADLGGDVMRHFVLQTQNILEIALIGFCPKVTIALRLDQLGRDSDAVLRPRYRAFHDRFDIQLTGNFREGFPGTSEMFRRRPRNDSEGANLREVRCQRLRDSLAEIFLAGIRREVLQRKDGNGMNLGGSGCGKNASAKLAGIKPNENSRDGEQGGAGDQLSEKSRPSETSRDGSPGHLSGNREPLCGFRWNGRRRDGADETVAASRDGFNEVGAVCRIAQDFPQAVDGFFERQLVIDEGVIRPKALA